jgi:hypothetical protein
MFKLKLWLTPLLCLLTGSALLFVGTTTLHGILMPAYDAEMKVLRVGIRGAIKGDISDGITATMALADAPDVRQSVGLSGDPAAAPVDLLAKPPGRLSKPGFALVADAAGKVVKKAGDAQGLGDNIAGLPAYAEALTGVIRDGFLRIGDAPYMVIGAPIVKERNAVGVVVLGFPIDGAYADALGLDANVQAVLVDKMTRAGSGIPDLTADDLKLAVAEDTVGELALELPVPLPLPLFVTDTKRYLAGGVAIYPGTGGPSIVLAVDRNEAYQALALLQLYVGAATLLLALLLSTLVLSILSSIARPMEVLMEHLGAFAQGGQVGILPETALQGPFVRLGKQINMILQAPNFNGPRPGTPPIAAVGSLGFGNSGSFPTSDPGVNANLLNNQQPSSPMAGDDDLRFEGIPGLDNDNGSPPPISGGFRAPSLTPSTPPSSMSTAGLPGMSGRQPGMPPLPSDAFSSPAPPAPAEADGMSTGLSGLFDDAAPDPLAAFRVAPQPARPTATPPAPAGNPYNADATVMFQVPQELIQESAATSQTGGPISSFAHLAQSGGGDERTVVAQVPAELINRSAAPAAAVPSADEQHYRQVFREFLDVRQQCGEDTDSLTYEKFLQKLMKNREQIIEKYNSKSVRFQVYVKAGKAALRAVPVRD